MKPIAVRKAGKQKESSANGSGDYLVAVLRYGLQTKTYGAALFTCAVLCSYVRTYYLYAGIGPIKATVIHDSVVLNITSRRMKCGKLEGKIQTLTSAGNERNTSKLQKN